MTQATELFFVDTNVFVYAVFGDSPHHMAARAFVDRALQSGAGFCTGPQVLAEYYAVVTDARRVTSVRKPNEAADDVERILELPGIILLPVPADFARIWLPLVRRYEVSRQDVFDAQIVAIMIASGVSRIVTFDEKDFERFSEVSVQRPEAVGLP